MNASSLFRFLMIFVLVGNSTGQAAARAPAVPAMAEPAAGTDAGTEAGIETVKLADLNVYVDALASSWADWSWDSTVAFDHANPTQSGAASIAVTFNAANAGLSLRTSPALSAADYQAVSFFVYAPDTDRALNVGVQTSDDGGLSETFSFNAPANQWSEIVVGLDSLGNPASIARVNIWDNSGAPQATLYLDQISLLGSGNGVVGDIPAVIPGAPQPTIHVTPGHGYTAQGVEITGVAPEDYNGVRLVWLFDGATFNAADAAVGEGGAYSANLEVPLGAPEGAAKLCAAVSGSAQAAFACVDFTVDPPAPGKIAGQMDVSLLAPGQAAEVQLLNRAGDALYSAALAENGTFLFDGIRPGIYEYVVVGRLSAPSDSGVIEVGYAEETGLSIAALLAGGDWDPVAKKVCNPTKDRAKVSSLWAQYTDRSLSVTGAGKGPRQADGSGEAFASGYLNALAQLHFRKDFGTYLNGVRLDNRFRASVQTISGTVEKVQFHIELPDGTLRDLPEDTQAPYEANYNMGDLPRGTSKLYAAAVVEGARQCPRIRDISVTNSPLEGEYYQPGAFVNWEAGSEGYRFGGTMPNVGGVLPLAFPSQPFSLPYLGNVQSKLGAGVSLSGVLYLDGVMQIEAMSAGAEAVLFGLPLFNGSQPVSPPEDGRFFSGTSPRDLRSIAVRTGPRTLWEDRYDHDVFHGVLFTFFGIVTVGTSISVGVGGQVVLNATIYPLLPGADVTLTPSVGVYLSLSLWVNILILASAGIDAIPSVHLGLPLQMSTYDSRGVWFDDPCFGIRVDLKAWVKVDYLFDVWRASKTWNLFKEDEPDGCLFAARMVAELAEQAEANAAVAPENPRVMASPQIASSFSGRVISVYVEDLTPQAERPSPAVMARLKDLQTGAWLPAVQISDGQHAVNDPRAAFFGFDGDQVMVAWTQTDMTQAEEEAADSLDDYLNQMEIYYSRWDGETWSAPEALTQDLNGDGFPVLAGDATGVSLAWVRGEDGDSITLSDMVIATRDWNPETGLGAQTILRGAPSGLNAQVSIARIQPLNDIYTALVWTYDADGSHETLEDRRLHLAMRGQGVNPAEWVMLDPQPLPARVDLPSLTFESGNPYLLRLAFIVHNLDGDGQSAAGLSDNTSVWTAYVNFDGDASFVSGQALLDEAGREVRGERPSLQTDENGETLLIFRRFGDLGSQGQLGQIAVSQFVDGGNQTNFSPPVYLTGGLNQHWQSAAALNPVNGQLDLLAVQRAPINVDALYALGAAGTDLGVAGYHTPAQRARRATLSPLALSAAANQVALLRSLAREAQAVPQAVTALTQEVDDDPLVAMAYGKDADPALDPLLELSQAHAVIDSSVTVTATVRNLGRTAAPAVVRFYRGEPGSGVLETETALAGLLAVGEVRTVTASFTVQGGEEPVYAEVVIDPAYVDGSSANNTATADLGSLPAPHIASVQPSQVFQVGLEIAIMPSTAQAVLGYRVLRSQTVGGPYELVGETTGYIHYDLNLTVNQTYCYVVQAYDRSGVTSLNSAEVCNLVPAANATGIYLPLINR